MLLQILNVLICLLGPFFIMWLTRTYKPLGKLGDIVLAYILGCLLGLVGIMPQDGSLTTIAGVAVPMAIPLLLFSADVRSWRRMAPEFIKSTVCCILAFSVAIFVAHSLVVDPDTNYSAIGGMILGRYTGGVVNQASIKTALSIPDDIYVVCDVCIMAVSALYLLLVIVFGKQITSRLLPVKSSLAMSNSSAASHVAEMSSDTDLFYGLLRKSNRFHLYRALALALIVILVGVALASLVKYVCSLFDIQDVFTPVFILIITFFSLILASQKQVQQIKCTFEAGTYFILVFSIAVSSQVNTTVLASASSAMLLFVFIATLGGFLLHVLFSALLRVDRDTTLVTSASLVCSPPFVPVVAGSLGNKSVIAPGIAVGLFGYAVGTYLGFALVYLLSLFF